MFSIKPRNNHLKHQNQKYEAKYAISVSKPTSDRSLNWSDEKSYSKKLHWFKIGYNLVHHI